MSDAPGRVEKRAGWWKLCREKVARVWAKKKHSTHMLESRQHPLVTHQVSERERGLESEHERGGEHEWLTDETRKSMRGRECVEKQAMRQLLSHSSQTQSVAFDFHVEERQMKIDVEEGIRNILMDDIAHEHGEEQAMMEWLFNSPQTQSRGFDYDVPWEQRIMNLFKDDMRLYIIVEECRSQLEDEDEERCTPLTSPSAKNGQLRACSSDDFEDFLKCGVADYIEPVLELGELEHMFPSTCAPVMKAQLLPLRSQPLAKTKAIAN